MVTANASFLIQGAVSIEELTSLLEELVVPIGTYRDVQLCDQYIDSPTWDLAKRGWAYHWRTVAGKRSIWLEPLRETIDTQSCTPVHHAVKKFPKLPKCIPRGAVREALSGADYGQLEHAFEIKGWRREFETLLGESLPTQLVVTQTIIDVSESKRDSSAPALCFTELHVMQFEGQRKACEDFVAHLRQNIELVPSRLSNWERALHFLGRSSVLHFTSTTLPTDPTESTLPKLDVSQDSSSPDSGDPVWQLVQRYLIENLDDLLIAEAWAWEGIHPEGVHRMRVATRRTRAAFKAFNTVLLGLPFRDLNQELSWLAARLGAVRDMDVYRDSLPGYSSAIAAQEASLLAGYQRHLTACRQDARAELRACLSSDRYAELASDLQRAFQSEFADCLKPNARKLSVAQAAVTLIKKQYKRVLRKGREIKHSSPSKDLHQLRIECKRLRYLFEIFRASYDQPIAKYIKRLKRMQELLGRFQDACVAIHHTRAYADRLPMEEGNRGQLLVCGQLIQSQYRVAQRIRESFSTEWAGFDRPGRLRKLLAELR